MSASQEVHERVAQQVVAQNPGLAQTAVETGNYLPLIRIAMNAEADLVKLWLAQRIGQIVRERHSKGRP